MPREEIRSTGQTPHAMWREMLPHFLHCAACATRGVPVQCVIRVMVFAEPGEYTRRFPRAAAALAAKNYAQTGIYALPTFPTAFGVDMVRISDMGACEVHRKGLEVAAARNPDWTHVHIDRGPEPNGARLVTQVAANIGPSKVILVGG